MVRLICAGRPVAIKKRAKKGTGPDLVTKGRVLCFGVTSKIKLSFILLLRGIV